MDRLAPTMRPDRAVVGYQSWRDLLFLHWPIPTETLRAVVPEALDIDVFDGQAYVGLVPFAMAGVRPRWWPKALAFEFLETNLRTYVHVRGRDPGVYFFSLEAASWLAVKAARIGWRLPYFHARMSMSHEGDVVSYHSQRRSRAAPGTDIRCRLVGEQTTAAPDTLEHFLLERYLLHVVRGNAVHTGQVHHSPYPVCRAELEHCDEQLLAAAGLTTISGPPALAHYSSGVDVEIFGLEVQPLANPA